MYPIAAAPEGTPRACSPSEKMGRKKRKAVEHVACTWNSLAFRCEQSKLVRSQEESVRGGPVEDGGMKLGRGARIPRDVDDFGAE